MAELIYQMRDTSGKRQGAFKTKRTVLIGRRLMPHLKTQKGQSFLVRTSTRAMR